MNMKDKILLKKNLVIETVNICFFGRAPAINFKKGQQISMLSFFKIRYFSNFYLRPY